MVVFGEGWLTAFYCGSNRQDKMTKNSYSEETLLTFPCEFPIKAMGKTSSNLEESVFKTVIKYAPKTTKDMVSINPSKNGNYISVTVTINATSKAQLDSIYFELTDNPDILYAL